MNHINAHRAFLLIIDAFLIAFWTQLFEIPIEGRIYPMIFIILAFLMSIVLIVRKKQPEVEKLEKSQLLQILIFGIWIFFSIVMMRRIGYILSSLVFLYGGEWFLKLKKNILFYLFPIVVTIIMYVLFTRVLSVILPVGTWISIDF